MTTNIKLKKSSVVGRVPAAGDLEYGEIAINYADGKIYYKNSSNDIKSFIDSAAVQSLIDNINIDSVGVATNSITLDGQSAAYYLNYNNFTNTPNILDSADVTSIAGALEGLDSTGVTNLIDSSYIGARINNFGRVGVTEVSFTADSGQTNFSTAYVAGALLVTLNGIILVNGTDYTATNGADVILTEAADSGDTLIVAKFGGDSARIEGVVDSAYIQARQTVIDSDYVQLRQDFAYSSLTGAPTVLDSANVSNIVTSYGYTAFDSAAAITLITANAIDSSVALQLLLDSIETINLIDSAYVQARQTAQDFAYSSLTGAPTVLDSANVTNLITAYGYSTFDSADAINLIDSAYVQLRQTDQDFAYSSLTGTPNVLDSADIINIIDSDYVQLRQDFTYSSLTGVPNVLDSTNVSNIVTDFGYTTFDSTAAIALITANAIDSSVALELLLDSIETINLIDSAYVQARQTAQDFAYSSLTGAPNVLDSADVVSLITANDQQRDSAFITGLIDSDFIETRRSAEAIFNVVNNGASAYTFTGDGFSSGQDNPTLYLQRGLTYKFSVNASGHPFQIRLSDGGTAYGTGVTNNGAQTGDVIFTPDMNAPNTLVYQCTVHSGMVGDIVIINDNTFLDSAEATTLITDYGYTTYDSTNTLGLIDSAYINARVDAVSGTDSATVISLITSTVDSAYIALREADAGVGSGGLDSSAVINLIDSAYVQARQTSGGSGTGTVDSDYVLSILAGANQAGITDFLYTADSGQTVFTGLDLNSDSLSFVDGSIQVFLNGILLRDTTDYTASSGNTITLLEGADSGDELSVFNIITSSGLDSANVISLITANDQQRDSAFITGIIDSDYISARTSAGTDSATVVTIIEGTVDSAYVQARQTSGGGGLDSAAVLDIIPTGTTQGLTTFIYEADSGQTLFSGTDTNGNTPSINPNASAIYLNGILLIEETDYTATQNSVTLIDAADSGDNLTIQYITAQSSRVAVSETTITADSGDTTFNVDYTPGALSVFLNGILLVNGTDYTATSGSSITLTSAADSGDLVLIQDIQGDSAIRISTIVDSDYVQLRQDFAYSSLTGTPNVLDSSAVITLITANDQQRDSAFITGIIDSDYVQARVTLDGTGLDSAAITNLIDSDYVSARSGGGGGGASTGTAIAMAIVFG